MILDTLDDLLAAARRAGADAADALRIVRTSVSVERRLGSTETLERAESDDIGLRVFLGRRSALVSAAANPRDYGALAERAIAMARILPEDPFAAPPDARPASPPAAALDLADPAEPDLAGLFERAQTAEEAGLAVAGITNSEGGSAGWTRSEIALATSAGFAGHFLRTTHSVSAALVAGTGTEMQRDYDYHATAYLADLDDPETIGRRAAERAVARLNPTRPRTATLPVVYDPRVSGGLIGHLASAANGAAVARGTSFLARRLGERILPPGTTVRDDPHRLRGLRSGPFDAEATPTAPCAIVEDGVLRTWILDRRSAAQLGLTTTGHASRGTGSPPSPGTTNLYLEPGTLTPAELMADIAEGIYITEMIGMGLNPTTGDYSRGAAGFMIRGGALAEPVAEITVAGNLLDMWARMTVANDLVFRRTTDAPTIRIDAMTVAGA